MKEFRVKHKQTGFVYVVIANDSDHARNKAISRHYGKSQAKDFKIIY